MIRVLHCVHSMSRGGVETLLMNIYRNIDRNKIQFDFLVHTEKESDYNQEIKKLGGKIFFVPPRNQGVLKNYNALNSFFKAHKEYKIVHQHVSSLSYITPLKVARKNGVPVRIVHSHNTQQGGNGLHKFIHKYNQMHVKKISTHYLACSKAAAKWLYPKKQYLNGEYEIINNAVNTDNFIFNEEVRCIKRKELGIENKFVIGHIGRFMHQKNHDYLVDIFKTVYDKDNNSILLLVGDGELRSAVEKKVKNLNLTDHVIFTGVRSDIPELLQAMDVFVMPSYHEGLPVTIVEAQAADLPCVLSNEITKEVEILETVRWCSLSDNSSIWAEKVLLYLNSRNRTNTSHEIADAGFDIKNTTNNLTKSYLDSLSK